MDQDAGRSTIVDAVVALQPRLRRFAYGLTGSLDEADDLVQSAYERALSRLDQWREGTKLHSWMFRIVQTLWLNRLAATRVRNRHLMEVGVAAVEDEVTKGDGMEGRLTLDLVLAHLEGLPEEQRAVLLLVALEGFTYQEAADILDVPVGTVTSRLGRARKSLAARLEGHSGAGSRHDVVTETR